MNIEEREKYRPASETIRAGKTVNLITPKEGDYMVSTLSHFNSLVKSGYKINGSRDIPPHDRMYVMYIGKHGLSQCSWGSPAVTEGRAIHSIWPGEWELGLTPLDKPKEVKRPKFDTVFIDESSAQLAEDKEDYMSIVKEGLI